LISADPQIVHYKLINWAQCNAVSIEAQIAKIAVIRENRDMGEFSFGNPETADQIADIAELILLKPA